MTANEHAVKAAGERLATLEDWMRKMFIVMTATSAMVAVTMVVILFGVYKYWQVTSAVAEAKTKIATNLDDIERITNEYQAKARASAAKTRADLEAIFRKGKAGN
jgi:hypothetical protein